MKCTALNECKISNISRGGGVVMPPDSPRPPTMQWHALHATNLSKPPHSENVVYVCVCVCVGNKEAKIT